MDYFQYLKYLNKMVEKYSLENGQTRNYIHLIRPYKKLKLNIVGEFLTEIEKEGSSFDESRNFTENSRCSFGVIPTYQFNDVKSLLESQVFDDKNQFLEYVINNCTKFCIDDEEFELWKKRNKQLMNIEKKHLQMALFSRVILAVKEYYIKKHNDSSVAIYSGCIPRLLSVEFIEPNESNTTIGQFKLQLGHTSYITMFGLSKFDVMSDDLMNCEIINGLTCRELNKIFDEEELNSIKEYMSCTNANDANDPNDYLKNELLYLNNYLSNDLNVHNINVSGNLITSDGYCIFTQRGGSVVDEHTLYPSVNGGAEIFDDQVEFYKNSVEEDFPTILYNKDKVHFSHEHTREAVGELGINDNAISWNYLGISVMAGKPHEKLGSRTPLHFNILAEKYCLDTFDNLNNQRMYASESFENENMFGYNLNIFKNRIDLLKYRLYKIIKWCMSNKDIVTIIFLLIFLRQTLTDSNIKKLLLGIIAIFLASGKEIRGFIFGTRKISLGVLIDTNNIEKKIDYFADIVAKRLNIIERISLYLKSFIKGRQVIRKPSDPVFMLLSMLRLKKIYGVE